MAGDEADRNLSYCLKVVFLQMMSQLPSKVQQNSLEAVSQENLPVGFLLWLQLASSLGNRCAQMHHGYISPLRLMK